MLIISHGKLVASDTPDNLGKLAAGSNNLNLLVKGEKSRIRQLLEEISGVKGNLHREKIRPGGLECDCLHRRKCGYPRRSIL